MKQRHAHAVGATLGLKRPGAEAFRGERIGCSWGRDWAEEKPRLVAAAKDVSRIWGDAQVARVGRSE